MKKRVAKKTAVSKRESSPYLRKNSLSPGSRRNFHGVKEINYAYVVLVLLLVGIAAYIYVAGIGPTAGKSVTMPGTSNNMCNNNDIYETSLGEECDGSATGTACSQGYYYIKSLTGSGSWREGYVSGLGIPLTQLDAITSTETVCEGSNCEQDTIYSDGAQVYRKKSGIWSFESASSFTNGRLGRIDAMLSTSATLYVVGTKLLSGGTSSPDYIYEYNQSTKTWDSGTLVSSLGWGDSTETITTIDAMAYYDFDNDGSDDLVVSSKNHLWVSSGATGPDLVISKVKFTYGDVDAYFIPLGYEGTQVFLNYNVENTPDGNLYYKRYPKVGEEVTAYITVKNRGNAETGTKEINAGIDWGDSTLLNFASTITNLAAGAEVTLIPQEHAYSVAGTYSITITADYSNEVAETNENNNNVEVEMTVLSEGASTICTGEGETIPSGSLASCCAWLDKLPNDKPNSLTGNCPAIHSTEHICLDCGDSTCDSSKGENKCNCPEDCAVSSGSNCGDGICDSTADEDCSSCVADCRCEADETCIDGVCTPPYGLVCLKGEYETHCAVNSAGAECSSGGNSVCCGRSNDCVYSGTCYSSGVTSTKDTADTSLDPEVCYNGKWYEQDKGDIIGSSKLCQQLSNYWLSDNTGGEGTDDYDNNPANGMCCGDDASEYKIVSLTYGVSRCCNSNTDTIARTCPVGLGTCTYYCKSAGGAYGLAIGTILPETPSGSTPQPSGTSGSPSSVQTWQKYTFADAFPGKGISRIDAMEYFEHGFNGNSGPELLIAKSMCSLQCKCEAAPSTEVNCGDTITQSTTLASDLLECEGNGLIIGADNIVLDCAGHSITHAATTTNTFGAYLNQRKGVTVQNCKISNFYSGINLVAAESGIIQNNELAGNNKGIALAGSTEYKSKLNTLIGNKLNENQVGIELITNSVDNTLQENEICGNTEDIKVDSSSSGNTGTENKCDTSTGWSEGGKQGCTYTCTGTEDCYAVKVTGISPLFSSLTNYYYSTPRISPDGTKIAFKVIGSYGINEVWTVNMDGTDPKRLVSNAENPVWSPNGVKIAFSRETATPGTNEQPGIYTINADGTGAQLILAVPPSQQATAITYSVDDWTGSTSMGDYIVYTEGIEYITTSGTSEYKYSIYRVRALPNQQAGEPLISTDYNVHGARVAPDGKLAFVSELEGNQRIYITSDRITFKKLLELDGAQIVDGWSSDSSMLSFTNAFDNGGDYSKRNVYVINSDGSGITKITDYTAFTYGGVFTAADTKLVFVSNKETPLQMGNFKGYLYAATLERQCTGMLPDLKVKNIEVTVSERQVQAKIVIQNDGNGDIDSFTGTLASVYFGDNTQKVDINVGTVPFSLPAGQSKDFVLSHSFASDGYYIMTVEADPDKMIEESNEQNNIKTQAIAIGEGYCAENEDCAAGQQCVLGACEEIVCGDTITGNVVLSQDLEDCSPFGLIIGADGVTLDCAGHFIWGDGSGFTVGVYMNGHERVSVKNCFLNNLGVGISFMNSSNSSIEDTAISDCSWGVYLQTSSKNTIHQIMSVRNSMDGIYIKDTDETHIINSYVCQNSVDIANEAGEGQRSNTGFDNFCNATSGWQDNNSEQGCRYTCDEYPEGCMDQDGDGYGIYYSEDCIYSGIDCDDSNPNVNPGATEACSDGTDNDCDGTTDSSDTDCGGDSSPLIMKGSSGGSPYLMKGGGSPLLMKGFCKTDKDKDFYYDSQCTGGTDCNDNNASINPGVKEVCDGLDNNCDKAIDNVKESTPLCSKQMGVCLGSTMRCGGKLSWLPCGRMNYGRGYEQEETSCDGLDNDCDGSIDESCTCEEGASRVCGTNIGICKTGTQKCISLRWGVCEGGIMPQTEVCGNTIDEDCNGKDLDCQMASEIDSDKEGLTDAQEAEYGTDPYNPDTDGDTYNDYEEVTKGTDPLDPKDYPGKGLWWKIILLLLLIAIIVVAILFLLKRRKNKQPKKVESKDLPPYKFRQMPQKPFGPMPPPKVGPMAPPRPPMSKPIMPAPGASASARKPMAPIMPPKRGAPSAPSKAQQSGGKKGSEFDEIDKLYREEEGE